jgi:hypothetical protein
MLNNLELPQTGMGVDPIDQYLGALAATKNYLETALPRLDAGINQILSGSPGNGIPNSIPLNGTMNQAYGNNRGLTSFSPQPPKVTSNGTKSYLDGLISGVMVQGNIPKSQLADRPRQIGFGAGPDKLNFERYYNHSKFKDLGWNPYIDNETIYNNNSSWWNDLGRASTQWMGLAGLGFKQTLTNWDDLFTLNTSGDTRYAKEMNRMMSIASSTRGGLGGFAVNQYANSAYTFGVIGEMVAEEAVLFGATAATEGALAAPALARTGANLKRLFSIGNKADEAADLIKASKTVDELKSTSTAVNSVQDISQARKFWNGVAGFISPFSETSQALKNIKTGANGYDKLTDFAKNAKTFGAFFRDMRLMNATLAESRLEGGFVQNEVLQKLQDEWYKNNVDPPSAEKADEMVAQAKQAGISTTMMNIPAILYSNKIVFDKALAGFKPFRDAGKGSLGTMVTGSKKGRTLYQGFIDTSKPSTWFTKKYWKNAANQFKPKNIAKNGLRYMSANLTEGFQEVYQEATAEAMKNYYLSTYASPERAGSAFFMSSLADGFKSMANGKGAEVFASGFLMGGLVQGPQTLLFEAAPQMVKDFREKRKDPANFAKVQARREEARTKITNFLNDVSNNPKRFFDPIHANFQKQKDFAEIMIDAENNGNKKEHEDARQDSLYTHIELLASRGYTNLLLDQIDSFKNMSDTELMEAFNYGPESGKADEFNKDIRERLDGIANKVEQIQKRYDKYSTIINPFNDESDDIQEQLDYFGFEEARKMAIYNEYTYDNAQSRMSSILSRASQFAGGKQAGKITSIFNAEQLANEIKTLGDEVVIYSTGNAEQKSIGKQKEKELDALKSLRDSLSNYALEIDRNKKNAITNQENADTLAEALETTRGNLEKDLRKYLSVITGLPANSTQMESLVLDYQDYNELLLDSKNASDAVNKLNDPNYFFKSARKFTAAAKEAQAISQEYINNSLEAYKNRMGANDILKDLYTDFRVFLLPADLEGLINEQKMPTLFMDVESKNPISPMSARYKDILEYLTDYEEANGIKLQGKPTEEAVTETEEEETEEVVDLKPEVEIKIEPISIDTPLGEMPKDLIPILKAQFNSYNDSLRAQGKQGISNDKFSDWVKTNPLASNIINRYNLDRGLIKPEDLEPKIESGKESINFDQLAIDTVLVMRDTKKFPMRRGRIVELSTENKTITVQPTGMEETFEIQESEFPNEIVSIFKRQEPVETTEQEEGVKENIKEVTTKAADINDIAAEIKAVVDEAKNMTQEEADDKFKKNLRCK